MAIMHFFPEIPHFLNENIYWPLDGADDIGTSHDRRSMAIFALIVSMLAQTI